METLELYSYENMENLFQYTSAQFDVVRHILTLGFGAQAAGLVYFLTTASDQKPRYRFTSWLSAVVMVSAALILYNQLTVWTGSFVWNGVTWELGNSTFSNGYRYVNWSIDVPMLLTQLLIVLGLTGAAFRRNFIGFVVAGLLMIWTGYVGQYYEVVSIPRLLLWGGVSTVFMIYICYIVGTSIFRNLKHQPQEVHGRFKAIFWVLILSWTLYPMAYLVPWFWDTAWGMVGRQIMFTTADIVSKVIYGVILGQIATIKSAKEGYEPAMRTLGYTKENLHTTKRDGVYV
jgi:bacteriorhodopsin